MIGDEMYEITKDNQSKALFRIVALPTQGYLTRSGYRLGVGSKFTQADLANQTLLYHHTGTIPSYLDTINDTFKFVMTVPGTGTIINSMYSACMPERPIPTPDDGIFTFTFTIVRATTPTVISSASVTLTELSSVVITPLNIGIDGETYTNDQIIHTVLVKPTNGFIRVRGHQTSSFTQTDIIAGVVEYVSEQLGDTTDTIVLQTCGSTDSSCIGFNVPVVIVERMKQIGDNVFYGSTNGSINFTLLTSRPDAFWEIIDGTPDSPPNSDVYDIPDNLVDWSSYTTTSDLLANDPGRGPGYDKLIQFRNLTFAVMWDGGLPTGVGVSNIGVLQTEYRAPFPPLAGSADWKLPYAEGSYLFSLKATDPRTGEYDIRNYKLVVNSQGLNSAGLSSESVDL